MGLVPGVADDLDPETQVPANVPYLSPLDKINDLAGLDPAGWTHFAGDHHLLIRHSSGAAYGLGRTDDGRLGEEAERERCPVPRLLKEAGALAVAAGQSSSFILLQESEMSRGLLAFGLNMHGELGLGLEEGDTAPPTMVPFHLAPPPFISAALPRSPPSTSPTTRRSG